MQGVRRSETAALGARDTLRRALPGYSAGNPWRLQKEVHYPGAGTRLHGLSTRMKAFQSLDHMHRLFHLGHFLFYTFFSSLQHRLFFPPMLVSST